MPETISGSFVSAAATEEADYFSVLGLPRTAGTEEVQRAHARLAAEDYAAQAATFPVVKESV